MTTAFLLRLFFALLCGGMVAAAYSWRYGRGESHLYRNAQEPIVYPLLLPIIMLIMLTMLVVGQGWEKGAQAMAAECMGMFLYVSVYFALLLCLLPLLRRRISARACAMLWLMPNFIYYFWALVSTDSYTIRAITLPRQWLKALGWIWAAGFALTAARHVVSHIRFRRELLRGARKADSPAVLERWQAEKDRMGITRKYRLVISPAAAAPLTIGLFSLRVVLPEREYTDDELRFIFRHELWHIRRMDIPTKAFIRFCTAMCWFNPLMWIAARKVTEDLELGCDEAVLENEDEFSRRAYAELIIGSAGDSRGFTTCLSARAESLRYRLANIVKPRSRSLGGWVVGAALVLLLMGYGLVGLADIGGSIADIPLGDLRGAEITGDITVYDWRGIHGLQVVYGYDGKSLAEYIGVLPVRQLYYGQPPESDGDEITVKFTSADGAAGSTLRLSDGVLKVSGSGSGTYIVDADIDWDYIDSLLDHDAPNPDPPPEIPDMMLWFNETVNGGEGYLYAGSRIVECRQDGEVTELFPDALDPSPGGVYGIGVERAAISFTYPPEDEFFTVLVENWERTDSYTVTSDTLTGDILPLAPYSAHYTVRGTFSTYRDTEYDMEFLFDVQFELSE